MKILLYMVILIGVLLLPAQGTDVGKLIPVEVIAVSESGGVVTINTDTGDMGQGNGLEEAFEDMKRTAPGIIYLDTAEYLILEEGLEEMEALRGYLKGDIQVCYAREGLPLEGIANYLSVHKSDVKLKAVSNDSQIPTITEENGRYLMVQK